MATVINSYVEVDGNGNVRANAKLYFYETGTVTPQDTYSDAALSAVNTNPVVADSNGRFPAMYLGDPPAFEAYKAILKTSDDVTVYTQDPIAGAPITTPISAALLRGYLSGLQMSSRTTTTITYGAGVCADDTNTSMITLASGTINCATVGADGLDAGALAVTAVYHVFAIAKTDGTVARLASASVSSPTMPSGYTLKRRIGSFKTDGSSQIRDFIQRGDYFEWKAPALQYSAFALTATQTVTLDMPTGLALYAQFRAVVRQVSGSAETWGADFTTPSAVTAAGALTIAALGGGAAGGTLSVCTNTSAQLTLAITASAGGYELDLSTYGWIDRRGRDD